MDDSVCRWERNGVRSTNEGQNRHRQSDSPMAMPSDRRVITAAPFRLPERGRVTHAPSLPP